MKQHRNHTENTELSYYGLSLLSFLKESHPALAGDAAFILARADMAAEAYCQAIKEGLSHDIAGERACLVLYEGLHFSRLDMIIHVLWNEFPGIVPQSRAKDFAGGILPECEAVFGRYQLTDEFSDSDQYDKLYTELTGFISLYIEENGL